MSCGKEGALIPTKKETIYKVEPAQEEKFSYEFTKKDCSTGVQSFNTFLLACKGLQNSILNNECAEEKREELFVSAECPGSFSEII